MIKYLLLIPIVIAILCYFTKTKKQIETLSLIGSSITFILGLTLVYLVFKNGTVVSWNNFLFADSFSAFIVLIVSIVSFVSSIYSTGYMKYEFTEFRKLKIYYTLFHIFVFTMLLVGVTNSLGMWIAIEMTTLVSALMMVIYSKKSSVEAAWKYAIISTVGITLALFGTILTYFAAVNVIGETEDALNWAVLNEVAYRFDPTIMKLAFIFILIGYGTKAGLAPMHTWIPDAYSESPTPLSALMSGTLVNCAMYGIIRFYSITSKSTGTDFAGNLLIIFGLLSLFIAIPFIILQENYKRLLAYSSVEHIGIIALGIGFGGVAGFFGAFLHMFNHAIAKTLMFFGAGSIQLKYGTKEIGKVSGIINSMPLTGTMFVIGGLAITGSPPFSLFISEFIILSAGFTQGYIISSVLFLLFVITIFAGFFYHISKMVFGKPAQEIKIGEINKLAPLSMGLLLILIIVLGVYIPSYFYDYIMKIIEVVR